MKNKKEKVVKEKKQIPFVKEMYKTLIPVNVLAGASIFIWVSVSILINSRQMMACLIFLVSIIAVAEGILSPVCHNLITKKLSADMEKWRRGEMDENERTTFFEDMISYPIKKKGVEAWLIFTFVALSYIFACHFIPQINISWKDLQLGFFMAVYGAYFATHVNVMASELLCNKYAVEIIKSGVNAERLLQKKEYGLNVAMRGLLYIIIPILFSVVALILLTFQVYTIQNGQYVSLGLHIARTIGYNVFCTLIVFLSVAKTAKDTMRNNEIMCDTIEAILTKKNVGDAAEDLAETNLNGKMQYNIFLLNQLIVQYSGILKAANKTNVGVRGITENLSVVASELASTSLEQSADVKEILGTMEEANNLSNVIREQTMGVTDGADKTKDDVNAADTALTENRNQIESIYNSNKQIIESIRNLGNQVENIDDVVTMIRDIADQTRIIAFNAELEAVGAGEEGRNFHIVAAETRRLASSTMESISNIQNYIEAIKEASKSLISSSESQTLFIQEEMQTIRELVRHFDLIKASAENTSTKSVEIEGIVDQQSSSFNQIVITLRQIGAGVESFTDSAASINESAAAIRNIALQLEHLQEN